MGRQIANRAGIPRSQKDLKMAEADLAPMGNRDLQALGRDPYTDKEWMIAKTVCAVPGLGTPKEGEP